MGFPHITEEARERYLLLSDDERTALTWDAAWQFVPLDTLAIAHWQGLERRRAMTPDAALRRVFFLDAAPASPDAGEKGEDANG